MTDPGRGTGGGHGGQRRVHAQGGGSSGWQPVLMRLLEMHGLGLYLGAVAAGWALMILGIARGPKLGIILGGSLVTALAFAPFLFLALWPLAGSRRVPPTLLALFAWPHSFQAAAIAANPATPAWALARLQTDISIAVRLALARNPATPADTLVRLSSDPDKAVREAVAAHADPPAHAVDRLAQDPCWEVRRALAANRQAPGSAVVWLATDRDPSVRRAVVGNEGATAAARAIASLGDPPES
jgi:hypothetical protein